MSAGNRISRVLGVLRNLRGKNNNNNTIAVEELVNPRLGINLSNGQKAKDVVNSLQLLMYSKENDTLFI
ncbi:hypothetical protein [Flavobacterium muglaense]|uniref:Uncharacterized protein n=1 Tax=Flavobacterium muglaense TaxID=2764716 RepID=A0A923N513_9FLAO|nr:hypothetical protein [Flavobacterium muglaense]MBC5839257.1 hypothetical protein [Flavobacterium muglaense]MBC5845753.1 hypothetical protein [Flavobacterium muglaense]